MDKDFGPLSDMAREALSNVLNRDTAKSYKLLVRIKAYNPIVYGLLSTLNGPAT
jgi:hypothetical protein